jgi:hypothetical protein
VQRTHDLELLLLRDGEPPGAGGRRHRDSERALSDAYAVRVARRSTTPIVDGGPPTTTFSAAVRAGRMVSS